jgi:hypothetical protein
MLRPVSALTTLLNSTFTRFVKHYRYRPWGNAISSSQDGGANRRNRLIPILHVTHEPVSGQKTAFPLHFTAIRQFRPGNA